MKIHIENSNSQSTSLELSDGMITIHLHDDNGKNLRSIYGNIETLFGNMTNGMIELASGRFDT